MPFHFSMKKLLIATLICSSFCINAFSQQVSALNADLKALNPQNIFPKKPEKNYSFKDANESANPSNFKVGKIKGSAVFSVEVLKVLPSHYGVQVSWKSTNAIKKGDVMLARFAMRSIYAKQESGEAVVNFYLQQAQQPFEKSVILPLGANPEWKEYNIPFIALNDMQAGAAAVCFSFGALVQKVEITNIEVLNFEQRATLKQLPETKFTYAGREKDATWREDALKRIEKIRKAPLVIEVVDASGKHVKDATVNAKLIELDFMFGTAVGANMICKDNPNQEIYQRNLKELFNSAVIDNGLKWPSWMNPSSQQCTKEAIAWINDNGFRLRGHNLVWPGRKFTPDVYKKQKDFGPGFQDSITNHIKEIATYTKGKVVAWDVINEMLHEKDYFDFMPRSTAAEWFKLAREIDPNAQLYINEYAMLNSVSSPATIKTYLALIDELKGYGAPIDAMGVQGHVGKQPRHPALVISDLDLLAKAGIPIQITEFDVNTKDEELQADYTRDFLIACFSHPSVTGFTNWGFWEAAHWKPDAAMFRKDWTEKPNGAVWRDLVTKQWTTNISELSTTDGTVKTNGFLGKYEITVTGKNGKSTTVYEHLLADGSTVKVELK